MRPEKRKLLKALAAAPVVVTLPSGAAVSQSSVSPECEAQMDAYNMGGPGLTATCLNSFGVVNSLPLING